jgi:hypothetical protein
VLERRANTGVPVETCTREGFVSNELVVVVQHGVPGGFLYSELVDDLAIHLVVPCFLRNGHVGEEIELAIENRISCRGASTADLVPEGRELNLIP